MQTLKWNMDKALHEITFLRVDISTWLQPKPKPAKPLPAPPAPPAKRHAEQAQYGNQQKKGRGKGKEGGKNQGKKGSKDREGKGKWNKPGKPSGSRFNPAYATDLWENGKRVPICMRWQDNLCTSVACKFAHKCAVKDANGIACGKNHKACEHDSAAAPRT